MKTGEYIDKIKLERNSAQEREAKVTKALRKFMVLHTRLQDGGYVRDSEWIEAILMGREALEPSE